MFKRAAARVVNRATQASNHHKQSLQRVAAPAVNNSTASRLDQSVNAPAFFFGPYNIQSRNKYSERVLDHYRNPRNTGKFEENDPNVGSAMVGAPSCGDVLKFQIKVDDDGKVQDAKFLTFGCGSAIASSSYATELVKGKKLEDCMKISNQDIASYLALPPIKKHCSLLAEEAIQAATKDYMKKKQNGQTAQQAAQQTENNNNTQQEAAQ